jgi:mannosyl-3-phosphoglycerate phosphatase
MVLIFTDLDGTLLNQNDYRYDLALPTIQKLQTAQIPIIPVTSKTKAEVVSLCQEIGLNDPFITENGSAIFMRKDEQRFTLPSRKTSDNYLYQMLGFNYEQARVILKQMSATLKTNLIGFGDLSVEEICQLTGLSMVEGNLAKTRDFTEPFLTPKHISADLLRETALLYHCDVVVGDRFSHLISKNAGKGNAVKWLLNNYKLATDKTMTIGLGNSPNDLSLLENVDLPIIVPGVKGVHAGLQGRDWLVAPAPGCLGWSLALTEVMQKQGILH